MQSMHDSYDIFRGSPKCSRSAKGWRSKQLEREASAERRVLAWYDQVFEVFV
jgi:hypothetical protein